jgi:hypothetical protein
MFSFVELKLYSFQNGAGSGCQIRSKLQLVTVNITFLKNHKHFSTIYRLSNEYFIDIKMLSGYMKLRYGILCLILRSQSRKIITTTAPAKSFGSLRLRLHSTWLTLTYINQENASILRIFTKNTDILCNIRMYSYKGS